MHADLYVCLCAWSEGGGGGGGSVRQRADVENVLNDNKPAITCVGVYVCVNPTKVQARRHLHKHTHTHVRQVLKSQSECTLIKIIIFFKVDFAFLID